MRVSANITGRRILAGVLVATALSACKKNDAGARADTSAAVTPAPAADTSGAASPAPAPATDVPADPGIASFSDANIAAKLSAGDLKEVELSRTVSSKITNPDLKDYAQLLITDHSKSKKEGDSTTKAAKIVPQAPPGDSSKKELASLKSRFAKIPKGAAFDTAFVNYAIQDHKQDIADHRAMQSKAQAQALKDLIQNGLPTLQKHLDRAVEISGKLH